MNKFDESYDKHLSKYALKESTQFKIPDSREKAGGIIPGDRIKFIENILRSDWFGKQEEHVQQLVKELHDGDLNLFVDELYGESDDIKLVVTRELAPGMQCPNSKVTLPKNLCELLGKRGDRHEAPIPDSLRGPERVTIKPEIVPAISNMEEEVADSPENQTLKADDGTNKLVKTDHTLPDKDIPGQKGGTYTVNYMS